MMAGLGYNPNRDSKSGKFTTGGSTSGGRKMSRHEAKLRATLKAGREGGVDAGTLRSVREALKSYKR
jgi:hypothetical protein